MRVACSSAAQTTGGGCPVLRGLPPRPTRHAWWQRAFELIVPNTFQRLVLGAADDNNQPPLALRPLEERVLEAPPQLGFGRQIIVGDGELARQVLAGEADGSVRQDDVSLPGFNELLGSESLILAQEPRHTFLRKLIMPAFTADAIERMCPRMQQVVAQFLERWADETAAAAAAQQGSGEEVLRPVGGLDALKHLTFVFILAVILGHDLEEQEAEELRSLFKTWSGGLLAWPWIDLGPFTRFGRARRARVALMAALQREVDAARAAVAAAEGGGSGTSSSNNTAGIIHSLVAAVDEDGNRLSDGQVCDNLLLLLFAGYDTSSVTLTNMLALLEGAPDVVAKLRAEQAAVVAAHGEAISNAALKAMPYAEAVIKETLRLRNVVPALTRVAARDLQLGGGSADGSSGSSSEGIAVPAGALLYVPADLLSVSDPRWAQEPSDSPLHPARFNPDRFALLPPDAQRQPGWQMPFGGGGRYCAGAALAGAEMKCFVALLARGYDVSVDADTSWTLRIGYQPNNGLPMRVTRQRQGQRQAGAGAGDGGAAAGQKAAAAADAELVPAA